MKRIIYLAIAVLVVVLAWSSVWFFVANEAKKAIIALADADGLSQPRLSCAALNISGFPFHFDVDCANAELTSGDLVVTANGLRASMQVYQPSHVLAWARGPVTLTDSFTGSKSALDWTNLQASLRLDNWRIARLSLVGEDLVWNDTLQGQNLIASSSKLEFHLLDIPEQHDAAAGIAALAMVLEAKAVKAPGFTIDDGVISLQAELSGIPDDVRSFGAPDILRLIQKAGGKLRIVTISASDVDSSQFDAVGELSLNPQGMLEGQADVSSKGVAERIGPLIVEPFRTLVLGNPDANGAYRQKLSARNGTIYSGLVPAGSIPPLF